MLFNRSEEMFRLLLAVADEVAMFSYLSHFICCSNKCFDCSLQTKNMIKSTHEFRLIKIFYGFDDEDAVVDIA